jgi:hypothetical protein
VRAGPEQEQEVEEGAKDAENATDAEGDTRARVDPLLLRKFQRDCANPLKQDLVVTALAKAIKDLPRDSGKEQSFRKLVLAFEKGGFAECKRQFANTELLRKATELRQDQMAVPRTIAIGKWFAGQPALFQQALAEGDLHEVTAENGQLLYMYTQYTKSDKTMTRREVQSDAGKGLAALSLDFGFVATGNTAIAAKPLALTDAPKEPEAAPVANAPSKEPVGEPVPLAKTWAKLDEAVSAGHKQFLRAKRLLKAGGAKGGAMAKWEDQLAKTLSETESLHAELIDLNVDRDAKTVSTVHAKLLEFNEALVSLQSTCQVVQTMQSKPLATLH